MRVLGALYGVTLVVSPDGQDGTGSAKTTTATTPGRKRASKPAGNKKTASRAASATKNAAPVPPTTKTAKTAAGRSKQKTVRRAVDAPSNAEIRSWARRNGLVVRDRGRLPASIQTAYRNAQSV